MKWKAFETQLNYLLVDTNIFIHLGQNVPEYPKYTFYFVFLDSLAF